MAKSTPKTTEATTAKGSNKETIKSLAWLFEAAFRGFAGWALLNCASGHSKVGAYFFAAAGIYALATGAIIVVAHFVKAHKG